MKKTTIWAIAMVMALALCVSAQAGENEEKHEQASKKPVVKIQTSKGDILVELDQEKAPVTVANFLKYTDEGFYNDTIFHRVIKGFMIQGGGMTADMKKKKTKPPIKNEAANGLKNKRGTIAMARTNVPNSATSQFFINHKDNSFLDYRGPGPRTIGYAVFGKVIKGMDVVDQIAVTPTKPGDVPVKTVLIKSVTLVKTDGDKDKGHEHGEECEHGKEKAHDEKGHDKDEHKKDEHKGHDHD